MGFTDGRLQRRTVAFQGYVDLDHHKKADDDPWIAAHAVYALNISPSIHEEIPSGVVKEVFHEEAFDSDRDGVLKAFKFVVAAEKAIADLACHDMARPETWAKLLNGYRVTGQIEHGDLKPRIRAEEGLKSTRRDAVLAIKRCKKFEPTSVICPPRRFARLFQRMAVGLCGN